jgi:hypothetical protein
MLGLSKAYNCTQSGWLHIQMYIASHAEWQVFVEEGGATEFRIVKVPSVSSGKVRVMCNGRVYEHWTVVGDNEIRIQVEDADCALLVFTGEWCLMVHCECQCINVNAVVAITASPSWSLLLPVSLSLMHGVTVADVYYHCHPQSASELLVTHYSILSTAVPD